MARSERPLSNLQYYEQKIHMYHIYHENPQNKWNRLRQNVIAMP